MRKLASWALVLLLIPASVRGDEDNFQADEPTEEAAPSPEQQAAESKVRAEKAAVSFDAIMRSNEPAPAAAPMPAAKMPRHYGYAREADESAVAPHAEPPSVVTVPLDRYQAVHGQRADQQEKAMRAEAPPVTLGAATYRGEARHHALALAVTLSVTLGAPGRWKTVPLLGSDVVLVSARVGSTPIPTSEQGGYHVWVTRETGEKTLTLEILAPARGPRGSLEYDLVVDRTPVTNFTCRFPAAGLEPRLDDAVRSEVKSGATDTTLDATLQPTTRLHLVGFRDLGETGSAKARVYAESLNLLSVEESSVDLFSVIRYTILYGGTKDFQVLLPPGMEVVSADGEGAFRYTLEKQEDGTLLKGETAYPIRNGYEISLQLHRATPRGSGPQAGESFAAPLPRSRGVEREDGWLGVEVPGKLRIEEEKRDEALPVDVRQLPEEMVQSAVTPILIAYRYHSDQAAVTLRATRLPERAPSGASIDRIRATSVLSAEGELLTELRISLRNRLRHSLALSLPEGERVLSTLLDGQPVKPSLDEQGRLLLPLRRSAGEDSPKPFVLQVVMEKAGPALGAWGRPELDLPAFDLPVSSLAWTVYLPARNLYGALESDVGDQVLVGEGSWASAPVTTVAPGNRAAAGPAASGEVAASADTGAMPVRIKLPETGVRLDHTRYWLEADHRFAVRVRYLRSSWQAPLTLLGGALFALGCYLLLWTRRGRWPGILLALATAWPLWRGAGLSALVLAALLALVVGALRLRAAGWLTGLRAWTASFPQRFRERPSAPARTRLQRAGRWAMVLATVWVAGHVAAAALQLAALFPHPL